MCFCSIQINCRPLTGQLCAQDSNNLLAGNDNRYKSEVEAANPQKANGPKSIGPWITTQTPRILFSPTPEFPKFAEKSYTDVTVMLEVVVTHTGDVSSAVVKSSSDARFNSYAVEGVKKWKFRPAIAQGKPVDFTIGVPVDFKNR